MPPPLRWAEIVVTLDGESSHGADERLPSSPELSELAPLVAEFFVQIERV